MKRLIALLVLAAVALAPSTALGKSRAKVYRGTFQFVGADGDYVTGKFGKAQLVDGRRNDKLSVHVRRLAPRAKYVFRLQQGTRACEEGAPGGTDVPKWHYRRGGVLKTNRNGVANGSARSHRFRAKRDVEYFVAVHELTADRKLGPIVLCADLRTKAKGKNKGKDKGKADDKARGKSEDKSNGKADDKARGKSEESHGKSDAAPGHNKDEGETRANGNGNGKEKDKPRGKKDRR